jgi:hypothetical protein
MRISMTRLAVALMFTTLVLGCAQNADTEIAAPTVPDTPDGTVTFVAQNLVDHRPAVLWMALPETYRQDITEITASFAEKMDPAIYDRTMALTLRAVEVLKVKKDLIFESTTFQSSQVDPDQIDQALNPTFAIAETLLTSQISTLYGLGTIDWEQFLATTGATLLEHASALQIEDGEDPLGELATLEVETVTATDDTATLKLKTANEDPEEVEMVRVEGRWIPADLAKQWPEMVANARQKLDELTPEGMAAIKTQAMMGLGMAEGLIDQIATIESAEQFDAAVGPLLQGLMGSIDLGDFADSDDDEEDEDDEDEDDEDDETENEESVEE